MAPKLRMVTLQIITIFTIAFTTAKLNNSTKNSIIEKQPLDFNLIYPNASINVTLLKQMATPCTTPNNDEALCIEIQNCIKLLRQLTNKNAHKFILDSRCGSANEDLRRPLVCCGRYNNYKYLVKNPLPKICGKQNVTMISRIFGGSEAVIGEFPWMARLIHKKDDIKQFGCSGFLIHSKYVLTAGHCVKSPNIIELGPIFEIQLGEHNIGTDPDCDARKQNCADPPQIIRVLKTIPHPEYIMNSSHHHNDIGLILLKKGAKTTNFVQPICLPDKPLDTFEYWISGWGMTEQYIYSKTKLKVSLPAYSHSDCVEKFKLINIKILKKQICAGGEKNKDSCSGDSGGPLMVQSDGNHWYAAGVVSYGLRCGRGGWPGVYTNVTSYLSWIKEEIGIHSTITSVKRKKGIQH